MVRDGGVEGRVVLRGKLVFTFVCALGASIRGGGLGLPLASREVWFEDHLVGGHIVLAPSFPPLQRHGWE